MRHTVGGWIFPIVQVRGMQPKHRAMAVHPMAQRTDHEIPRVGGESRPVSIAYRGVAANRTTDNRRRSIGSGLVWLVPLAGVCLPVTSFLPLRFQTPTRIAIGLAAAVAWLALATHGSAPPRTIALLTGSDERRRVTWHLALLGVVAAATIAYLIAALRVTTIPTNDGAYYYGVARHIATTGRFEEPIVWHFLNPPDTIEHTPFDYWGPMTPLLLLPSLSLFGAEPATAFLTMAVLSAATLLAFWYLVCIALPL